MHPDSFEDAFRQLCSRAAHHVSQPRFVLWASDFRHKADAAMLRGLANVDVDAFLADRPPVIPPLASWGRLHA
jgi:hypothetical protein